MRRLLTHLAQFGSFYSQGELLCTQGLTYLLENSDARVAFRDFISNRAGYQVSADLEWRAEVRQQDGGRVDLEGCARGGTPQAKIEAKLGAVLGEEQLTSYLTDLQTRSGGGLLLVLVPPDRIGEATTVVSRAFTVTGNGPWRLADMPDSAIAVITWEEILETLGDVRSVAFEGDLAQFREMYRVLKGDVIEPITDIAEILKWREREGTFVHLVDRVSRRLTQNHNLMPMGKEFDGYQRRYVCRPLGNEHPVGADHWTDRAPPLGRASAGTAQPWPCFSLGIRDPFRSHITPIWLRFHKNTASFSVVRDNLMASSLSHRLVESGGHLWIPVDVQPDTDVQRQIDLLIASAEDVIRVAYQPPPDAA